MKHSIWRYVLLICLCAAGGGLSGCLGLSAIFRGAVLGACLAAAFPAIDYLRSKGKCRSLWTAALVGMLFGLLAGIIICAIQVEIDFNDLSSLYPLLQCLFIATTYGFLIHLSIAIKSRWQLPAYFAAMLFCHHCRYFFAFNSEYEALLYTLYGFLPFTVLWYLPVMCLLPRTKQKSAIINNSINQQGEKVL